MGAGVGTVAGLLSWFPLSLKSAFALVGMAAFAQLIVPINAHIAAVFLALLFVGLNPVGVKEVARLQVTLVFVLFGLMLFYIIEDPPEANVRHFEPFAPNGLTAVFSTVGFVFVSHGGVLKIASVGEETRNPGRTIPPGMILSLLVVGILSRICYADSWCVRSGRAYGGGQRVSVDRQCKRQRLGGERASKGWAIPMGISSLRRQHNDDP
jgi:amino acid transporter